MVSTSSTSGDRGATTRDTGPTTGLRVVVLAGGGGVMAAPEPLNALTLNIINLTFLLVGMLLHKTPARLMRAVQDATPAVWGVLLQFPFYAGIAGIITGTHLSQQLASAFVQV